MSMKIENNAEDVEYFNFKSPFTGTSNIDIHPIGMTYTYRKVNDNSDIKNEMIRNAYNKVPYIGALLLKISNTEMVGTCKDTNISFNINKPINRSDMLRYLKEKDMEPPMRL
jgi:hypothetical protein